MQHQVRAKLKSRATEYSAAIPTTKMLYTVENSRVVRNMTLSVESRLASTAAQAQPCETKHAFRSPSEHFLGAAARFLVPNTLRDQLLLRPRKRCAHNSRQLMRDATQCPPHKPAMSFDSVSSCVSMLLRSASARSRRKSPAAQEPSTRQRPIEAQADLTILLGKAGRDLVVERHLVGEITDLTPKHAHLVRVAGYKQKS